VPAAAACQPAPPDTSRATASNDEEKFLKVRMTALPSLFVFFNRGQARAAARQVTPVKRGIWLSFDFSYTSRAAVEANCVAPGPARQRNASAH
jgi:hypothetical protein